MNNEIIPEGYPDVPEGIYAGFWERLGSLFIDGIIAMPYTFLVLYLQGLGKGIYVALVIPQLLFAFWYYIYLVKRYGGTPGKLLMKIKVIKKNGEDVGWYEAIMRNIVLYLLTVIDTVILAIAVMHISNEDFNGAGGFLQRSLLITQLFPGFISALTWTINIWTIGELIVLLTNKRKRSIHDYMAGTVVIRTTYQTYIMSMQNPPPSPVTDDAPAIEPAM